MRENVSRIVAAVLILSLATPVWATIEPPASGWAQVLDRVGAWWSALTTADGPATDPDAQVKDEGLDDDQPDDHDRHYLQIEPGG